MFFVEARSREVSSATVNRSIAVLSHLLTYAMDRGIIETHPLARFPHLPEPISKLRVMTLEEADRLVAATYQVDPVIGVFVDVLAETGLRKSEALALCWPEIDLQARRLTVAESKSGKLRHVPITERAATALRSFVRAIDEPHVFVHPVTGQPWRDPRVPFAKARAAVGPSWVGFHDFRHYRATQWVKLGMPLREVKEFLGHRYIDTTMRYAHFVEDHAWPMAREIERKEAASR